jgi:RNA polymerase sigma-70 factor, ECF subfamily
MIFRRNTLLEKPSFESVVDAELPVLYRVALRLTRSQAEAEDLVGQTLYLAARAWAVFDGAHPRSWLIKILRNEHAGSARKRTKVSLEDQPVEPTGMEPWPEVDWKLVGDQILKALDQIPEDYRMAVALCDIEEVTREEAALALEVPLGTLNSRLHRGRSLLKVSLSRILGEFAPQ